MTKEEQAKFTTLKVAERIFERENQGGELELEIGEPEFHHLTSPINRTLSQPSGKRRFPAFSTQLWQWHVETQRCSTLKFSFETYSASESYEHITSQLTDIVRTRSWFCDVPSLRDKFSTSLSALAYAFCSWKKKKSDTLSFKTRLESVHIINLLPHKG